MGLPLGRVCGKCPDAARLHHLRAEKAWQQDTTSLTCRKDLATGRGQALVSAAYAVPSWTPSLSTEKPAAPLKPLVGTTHAFVPSWAADPGITTERTAAVPGRSAALEVCVASPNAAAARGDAAQAVVDRKLSNFRNEIPDSRNQGIHKRPLVWTADRRPHPAVTRTERRDHFRRSPLGCRSMYFHSKRIPVGHSNLGTLAHLLIC